MQFKRSDFPNHFFFETSTSFYQIKGVMLKMEGERVIGMFFSHIPEKIKNNDAGDLADNHYHRFMEDIELMGSMVMNAYRLSISWTRILPN
ncbi:hypothetical protein IC575_026313 [Cucumis melo]